MPALARDHAVFGLRPLEQGWQIAPADTGVAEPPWRPISGPLPVAALRAAGELPPGTRPPDAEGWTYRCLFDHPDAHVDLLLGLDGLATRAEVWLNGQCLLRSDNMFRSHRLPLPAGLLRPEGNELRLEILPLAEALAQRRPRPRWRVPMLAEQQLRWWRTTLLGRTPGWSPATAAPVGPWRPVWLAPLHPWQPLGLSLQSEVEGRGGWLQVALELHGGADAARAISLHLSLGGEVHTQALTRDAQGCWQGRLRLAQVARWWPHTHGEPVLYEASLQVTPAAPDQPPQTLPLGGVGFRSLALDVSDGGLRLVVNDVPIFARGACWMPLDPLRLQAGPEACEAALAQVRAAGLNLLRLPGCTVYESEAFHDACDRQGVLLWQDLMFANMDYPLEDAGFAAEVDAELAQQLPRWQARPSLAVVCGNSELSQQAAMWGADKALWAPALFHQALPDRVATLLPGTAYWPSSAWGGALPFQPDTGSTAYYGVGAYRRPVADARDSGLRFATECLAFAQIPDDDGLARWREATSQGLPLRPVGPAWAARVPRDLGAGWDFDDVRDHYVELLYGERAERLRATDPERYLALGRGACAEVLASAFQHWRAAGSRCGGALVWTLRDLQAGAGWGLLDEQGAPKAAFHALARESQALHLGVTDEGQNGLVLHLSHEGEQDLPGSLTLQLLREGAVVVASAQQACTARARQTLAVPLHALLDHFVDAGWHHRFGPPPADVLVARWTSDTPGGPACERVHFLDAGRPLVPVELGLQAFVQALDGDTVQLRLRSQRAARGLHLLGTGWQADDEHFHLAPGRDRLLRLRRRPGSRGPWRGMVAALNGLAPVLPLAEPVP